MNNIKILETGVDVSRIIDQLEQHPGDWGSQKTLDKVQLKDPTKYETTVDVLQLIMGATNNANIKAEDTDICIETPAYKHHIEIIQFLSKRFKKIHRCGFLSLPVGQTVNAHIDEGTYYLTRDRYHLSIQGRYQYFVGNENLIVEPGTLFWFNNKLPHGTVNLGDCARITFVFDVPHSPDNLQHKLNG
jgi:hypothetical protein